MSKFAKKKSGELPAVSTASLPDIVFMLLFFFMTVTVMKNNDVKVKNELPKANEIKKLEKKDRVITIYVGAPNSEYASVFGEEATIQLNDKFSSPGDVGDFILQERAKKDEADIKQELREVNALKVNYTTYEGDAFDNLKN